MTQRFAGAVALALALVPVAAQADDPNDPTMRSAAARARDKAIIKRLNEEQLAYVRQRDAGYAEGWRAYREAQQGRQPTRSGDRQADADYAEARADYQRRMAEWRHAVSACQSGRYEYCER
ncbi:hypothetical protein H7F51_00290 [Novosphingobium flavum]|uniref:Uncharacterized protein n=2 Tax=Novosphingobium flavum TaxID=1778672 RepID=A0A7X1FNE3_9SPHN|nr:hypothetical protein [Novosphingobium flavum]